MFIPQNLVSKGEQLYEALLKEGADLEGHLKKLAQEEAETIGEWLSSATWSVMAAFIWIRRESAILLALIDYRCEDKQ